MDGGCDLAELAGRAGRFAQEQILGDWFSTEPPAGAERS
jgi:hypothetical protein